MVDAQIQQTEFALIDPPQAVARVTSATRWRDIRVDYERHPAYAELTRASLGTRAAATAEFLTRALLLLAKRTVRYEMIPLDYRKPKTPGQAMRFAATAVRNMVVPASRPKATARDSRAVADRLHRDGCVVVAIGEARFEPIEAAADRHFQALAARRHRSHNGKRAFDDSRMTLDKKTAPELYATIEAALKQSGIFDAASEHLGRPARLVDINPQINDVSDSFWRDIYPDRGPAKLPATAYYHRDASGGDLKAIIYFSEVGAENGPFNYALGTNALDVSAVDNFVTEANDHNGFSGTDLTARTKFAALPKLFRQKGSYGNDLDDADPFSRKMVESTWAVAAPKGSIVLFDTKGTHRGGMVEQGERRVVTCVIG